MSLLESTTLLVIAAFPNTCKVSMQLARIVGKSPSGGHSVRNLFARIDEGLIDLLARRMLGYL